MLPMTFYNKNNNGSELLNKTSLSADSAYSFSRMFGCVVFYLAFSQLITAFFTAY